MRQYLFQKIHEKMFSIGHQQKSLLWLTFHHLLWVFRKLTIFFTFFVFTNISCSQPRSRLLFTRPLQCSLFSSTHHILCPPLFMMSLKGWTLPIQFGLCGFGLAQENQFFKPTVGCAQAPQLVLKESPSFSVSTNGELESAVNTPLLYSHLFPLFSQILLVGFLLFNLTSCHAFHPNEKAVKMCAICCE